MMALRRAFRGSLLFLAVGIAFGAYSMVAIAQECGFTIGDATAGIGYPVAVGDFNADTIADLAIGTFASNVSILVGNGDGTFASPLDHAVSGIPWAMDAADFDGDGDDDVVVGTIGTGAGLFVLSSNGNGTLAAPVGYAVSPNGLAAGDLDGDGWPDLAAAASGVSILLNDGDGTFADPVPYAAGSAFDVVIGEFNRDGLADLAAAGSGVQVLLGNGDGTFQTAVGYPTATTPRDVVTGDFNRDGIQDLVTANPNFPTDSTTVLLGVGDGTFASGVEYDLGVNAGSVAVADFNGDHIQDLAFGAIGGAVPVLFGIGDGSFSVAGSYSGGIGLIVDADLNGDLQQDLAIGHSTGVRVLLNNTPAIQTPASVPDGTTGVTASITGHAGSSYVWTLDGGMITAGQGTPSIEYTAGPAGTRMTLSVSETLSGGCSPPAGSKRVMADFHDVPPSHLFHDFVTRFAANGITGGCGAGNYCPDNPVLRSQMAIFLLRGVHYDGYVPPAAVGIFTDVLPGSFGADFIERLYAEGITGGCATAPLRYCPNGSVLRSQMAVFLLRSRYGRNFVPPPATGLFEDVPPGSFAADWIEQLFLDGITGGCSASPPRFCPNSETTRGAMAVFLTKTFGFP